MKKFAANPMTTLEYDQWRDQRINDNIPMSNQGNPQSIEEHLKVIPTELEIIRQDFERKSLELEKRIEQLEEEKMQLGLDVDVQKLEAERFRKGKNKAKEDLDSLKMDYKKLRRSMRTAGLGKNLNSGDRKLKKSKAKPTSGKKNSAMLKLEKYRSRNSVIELKASQSRIEELKENIEELKTVLQNRELQMELLEVNNERFKEQLHQSQDQVRNRDYVMGEALTQVREVADHLQMLAVQVDVLSLKYESELDEAES
ncbi:calcium-binding and coiled-coil domain-containing protein 2-like [Gossypium hirsutum]|uniref:Calcium-binding and coiled-coil domain-containing protein 2-like n=1 Tax=Gossypium hirsutum TaxID=3635 RepID=A0ABM2ZB15_GOSHI|nr:calcium-binding and coiled-coil domain-containing protein 2-like [Gossypium hirsutum]